MSNIAIITARGGSKRIPKKNIIPFCGKPMIAYSIEAALNAGVFDEVMVSTDDEEIAGIAREYGAKVPFMRSERTSNDYATTNDVLSEVINEYQKRDKAFEIAACIYPTAPFITKEKLKEAYGKLLSSDADALIPVVAFSYPPQRAYVIEDGELQFERPEYALSRSQDLTPLYHDAGQFYFFRVGTFLKNGSFLTGKRIPYELSELEVQDIDNMPDLKIAELKYKAMHDTSGK